jgi:hypothetical protein
VQFITGLVKMVTEKLHSDLMHLQYDDSLFTHTLDETLGFYRELKDHYGYPSSCPSVLSVLTQAQIFIKWINMERKCTYLENLGIDALKINLLINVLL